MFETVKVGDQVRVYCLEYQLICNDGSSLVAVTKVGRLNFHTEANLRFRKDTGKAAPGINKHISARWS